MRDSTLNTLSITGLPLTATARPSLLAVASDVAARVVVRNVGPVLVFLAFDVNALSNAEGPSSGVFQLQPNASEVFVLAPKQRLVAVGVAGGGKLSIAQSEALEIQVK